MTQHVDPLQPSRWPHRAAGWATFLLLLAAVGVLRGWPPLAPDDRRAVGAGLILLTYLVFCVAVALRRRAVQPVMAAGIAGAPTTLVVFASQTGFAEQLARQSAVVLQAGGDNVRVVSLAALGIEELGACTRALFVVSTTGEGDAPDSAGGFARKVMSRPAALPSLDYGLMALGDRSYAQYNAFGLAVDKWLHASGARPLFDTVLVDNGDHDAIRHWQQYLGVLSGKSDMPDWSTPHYHPWQLHDRRLLNAGSPGAPAFHIGLRSLEDPRVTWQAGDIAEVGPCNRSAAVQAWLAALGADPTASVRAAEVMLPLSEALADRQLPRDPQVLARLQPLAPQAQFDSLARLPHREYSIASLPADGELQLLVRQVSHPDGQLGLGSGWLTAHAPEGARIALRIRSNSAFHPPARHVPLILIGNGTGLAGLRAHLKARAAPDCGRNWLIFGERTRAHDFFHRDEIEDWQRRGVLTRVDLAFSRDPDEVKYVQHVLPLVADELRRWVAEGAAIYVCGSLQGMAGSVATALTDILGAPLLEQMAESGRYRRDVY